MNVFINGQDYTFVSNAIKNEKTRNGYFDLVHRVFGLSFEPWYQSGFCKDCFIPYTLFVDNAAVSSVGIVINDFNWRNNSKRYAQISFCLAHKSQHLPNKNAGSNKERRFCLQSAAHGR